MSLIAAGTGNTETPLEEIANNGFWPAVSPSDFRDAERLDGTVTAPRLVQALRVAMADVNRQLADYQAEQQAAGIESAAAIPLEPWQIEGHQAQLYRRAVYAQAHADLLERYRSYSAIYMRLFRCANNGRCHFCQQPCQRNLSHRNTFFFCKLRHTFNDFSICIGCRIIFQTCISIFLQTL